MADEERKIELTVPEARELLVAARAGVDRAFVDRPFVEKLLDRLDDETSL